MASRTITPTDPANTYNPTPPTAQQQAALAAIRRGDTAGALAQSTTINRYPDNPTPQQPTQRSISAPPQAPQQSAQDIMKADFSSGNQQQIQGQADALSQPTSLMGAVQDALNQRIKMSRGEWNDKTTQAYTAAQSGPDSQVNRITAGMNLDPSTVASIYGAQAGGQSADLQQVLGLQAQDKQQQQQNLDKFAGTITELGKQYLQKSQDMKSEQQQVLQNKFAAMQLQLQVPQGQKFTDPVTGGELEGLGANDNTKTFTTPRITNPDGTVSGGVTVMYDAKTHKVLTEFDVNGQPMAGKGVNTPTPDEQSTFTEAPQGFQNIGGKIIDNATVNKIFGVNQKGGQCGHYANVNSTGPKVGDSWQSKVSLVDKFDDPKAGDKLVEPMLVGTDGKGYGHVRLVLGYDPKTRMVWGTDSNLKEDEVVHQWHKSLDDLHKQWDHNKNGWGFISGDLKSANQIQLQRSAGDLGAMLSHSSLGKTLVRTLQSVFPQGAPELAPELWGQDKQAEQPQTAPVAQLKESVKTTQNSMLTALGVDVTSKDYKTPNSKYGGLSPAAIDQQAMNFLLSGSRPPRGAKGIPQMQSTAIMNRMAEIDPGGNIAVNKDVLDTYHTSLTKQVSQMDQTTKGLAIADRQFKSLLQTFSGSGINPNDSQFANTHLNELAKNFGNSSQLKAFQAGLNDVSQAYAQVYASQTGSSNAGNTKTAQDILNGNMSFGDLQTIMKTMQSQGQIDVQESQKTVETIKQRMNNIITTGFDDSSSTDDAFTQSQDQGSQGQRTMGGTIRVREKSSGQTGSIPENEFDPSQYDKI